MVKTAAGNVSWMSSGQTAGLEGGGGGGGAQRLWLHVSAHRGKDVVPLGH